MFNDLVRSVFEGIKEARETSYYPRKFEEMKKTNLLFEVDDLTDMYKHARDKEDYETILDHMYRFEATEVGYYRRIEKRIINHYWEE